MSGPPGREPPAFVPTLTEVVATPPVPATHPVAEADRQDERWADVVDQVTDRVLVAVMGRVEQAVNDALHDWVREHGAVLGQQVARAVLADCAQACRDAVSDGIKAQLAR